MQAHTEHPSVSGVPVNTVKPGGSCTPRTTFSGNSFGRLMWSQPYWLVQKIQITLPVLASRQKTKLLSVGFSPSPMPT